jgi:pimeloyl-ACP methyl ester carboxylesterase
MYYEIHGSGEPLILLHGGLATIDVPFGPLIPALAATRQVIAVEQQGHGHTADIDRPLTYEQMTDDTAALLRHLEIGNADVLGFSMGGTTALALAFTYPDLVRKVVVLSASFNNDGMRPENLAGMQGMTPDALAGSPFEAAYLQVAPKPEDWPVLLTKMGQLSLDFQGWSPDDLQAIAAPTLVMLGDADAVQLDHAVELLRLLGGDVNGDFAGVPASQLAILPGTTHFTALSRVEVLKSLVMPFLDSPMPDAG